MKLLAQSRSLSYKAKRNGDIILRQEARRLRNLARYELKRYQQSRLTQQLKERNVPSECSTIFWSKTKRHFRTTSSSLRGFILPNDEIIKEPQAMVDTAADYYETLFEAPVVIRPHPYVDAPNTQCVNVSEPIPLVTYPENHGILPDNQSGFRAGHRLQTRVLLLIEQISSYMSNSSPVATVFVDFKSAFDQLWFEGCLGKLCRMGIPSVYAKWIQAWLNDRQATIEIQ
ncbi:unnamed protein product, partial [Rotaria magnacalcarata]